MRRNVGLLWVIASAAMVFGCAGKRADRNDEGAPAQAADEAADDEWAESQDAPAFGGGALGNLSMLGSLFGGQLDQPGPYDEPRRSPGFRRGAHLAVLELEGDLVELEAFRWFGGGMGTELRALTDRLAALAADRHVTGLLVRADDLGMSVAMAEELRAALVAFKTAGDRTRTLACHTERVSSITYYVLSACDRIGLAPTGEVVVHGVAAVPVHIKGLLDKAGVRPDFLHVGDFKGAAEPLTRDRPSREMVVTIEAILDQAYATMIEGIAEGRELPEDRVRQLVDEAVFIADAAVEAKLVDEVALFETFRDAVADGPWQLVKVKSDSADVTKLMQFLGLAPRTRPTVPHVALVYAVGDVIDGKGSGALGARAEIASRTLAAAIRTMANDDSVKAIVLRVDSGGGSALASELIWHAVGEARERKPVIVSMGGVAASGGYYIGAGANKIYATRNTLTGSIGVVGGKLTIGRALDKLGVKAYPMGRGQRALMGSMVEPWTAQERRVVQQLMQSIYDTFVARVAAGRDTDVATIHAIAQGRVWTGEDARERGLVDAIGGLEEALAEARTLGGVDESAPLEVYPQEPTLMDLISGIADVSMPYGLDVAVAATARELGVAEAFAVERALRQLLLLSEARVLAAMIFPVVIQ